MSKITIIGAGKTGRGFLARLLSQNEITFIDKNEELVNKLNQSKKYSIDFFGNQKENIIIENYTAKTWETVDSIDADLILVSVGGKNLFDVGEKLKKYIKSGQRIIVAENASNPAKTLFNALNIEGVKIAESTVFCTTIENGDLDISSESYPYLQFDADVFDKDCPNLLGLKPIKNFGNFLNRKLFTYNSASCIIAYLGYLKGYTVYADASNDKEILSMLDKNYEIINDCMCKEYGYDENDQREFALLSRIKFTDTTIKDTVLRNGREPQRKITKNERIVGPLLLEQKYNKDTTILEKTLASMFLFTPECEKEWIQLLEQKGYENILTEMAGIEKDSNIYKNVLEYLKNPQKII